jgi:hypothetical protein
MIKRRASTGITNLGNTVTEQQNILMGWRNIGKPQF